MANIYLFDALSYDLTEEATRLDLSDARNTLRNIVNGVRTLNRQIPLITDGGKHDETTAASDRAVISAIELYLEKHRHTFAQIEQLIGKIANLNSLLEPYSTGRRDYFGVVAQGNISAEYLEALSDMEDKDLNDRYGKFFLDDNDVAMALPQKLSGSLFELFDDFYDFADGITEKWETIKSIFYQQGRNDFSSDLPLSFTYPGCPQMHSFTHCDGPYTFGWVQHNRPLKEVRKEVVSDFIEAVTEEGLRLKVLCEALESVSSAVA